MLFKSKSMLGIMVGLLISLSLQAAPIVVTPGSSAGYIYFPPGAASGGGGGGTSASVNVTVSSSPKVIPTVKAADAGACATVTTVGQSCLWGDGSTVKYAGLKSNGKKLFAALENESSALSYGCYNVGTGASSLTDGFSNTNIILKVDAVVNGCQSNNSFYPPVAFYICQDKGQGYFLPARDELNLLYINKSSIGGFSGGGYWSSSEYNLTNAWNQEFSSGSANNSYGTNKGNTLGVRCVRSF